MESEWLDVPSKVFIGCTEKTCPRCGCKSFYDMTPQVAWCWASGVIEIGDTAPEDSDDGGGAIVIAEGPKSSLRGCLEVMARHAYDGRLLVPGVPEAETQREAADALGTWLDWCAKRNGRRSSDGVTFAAMKA